MRNLLLALACLLLMAGLVAAAEVTLLEFDREQKQVTVKEGDAQKVYRLTEVTKFFGVDENGTAREMTYDDAVKGLGSEKAKGKLKFDLSAQEDEATEVKFKARKRK